ncbi:transporter substrate-binding domain-containing protein [Aliiglaciecola sp. CAU 1673]|uniref:substrate-binding periplasmic protein n=1 Tax=Aliiglaciecola sp. CAU 1673 TaxID=3032595 RepID=UPI0023D9F63B|nr:transporter substrate-binding domain-containing protein [Aliiglaciecola sp. CAU 1673]MDF2180027.1 transporter substrate-binding domain-containing protein [Aliiglaciecola sp. CAU 1673]
MKKLRYLPVIQICLLALVLFGPHANGQALVKLRMITELSPPAQTVEAGVVGGNTTEKVRKALNLAGLHAEFEVYPWARAFDLVQRTPNSFLYATARTPKRETLFHWIGPVGQYQLGLLKLSSNSRVQLDNLEDALPYTIAIQREDFAAELLRANGFKDDVQLIITADIRQSWELLVKGKVDMVVDDPSASKNMLDSFNLKDKDVQFALMLPQLAQTTYLAANLETDPQIVQKLRDALARVNNQG